MIEGYHTKIRLWVKPKAKINSLRKVVCKEIDEEEGEPPKPMKDKEIFSRITVISNEADKNQDENC